MELAVRMVAEKRVLIDKNYFIKGRQDIFSGTITAISNLDALCAFLCDCITGDVLDLVRMIQQLSDIFSTSEFQKFAENERSQP